LDGRDSRTDGGKGTSGRRLEKEDIIIVQWAQEDVKTSYNLVNNNNNNNNNNMRGFFAVGCL
jgi:hypothetical protein